MSLPSLIGPGCLYQILPGGGVENTPLPDLHTLSPYRVKLKRYYQLSSKDLRGFYSQL